MPSCGVSQRSKIDRVMLQIRQLSVESSHTTENRAAIQDHGRTSTGLGSRSRGFLPEPSETKVQTRTTSATNIRCASVCGQNGARPVHCAKTSRTEGAGSLSALSTQ